MKGSILDRYRELGGPTGPVGWPTSDETCVPGGCSVSFTGGVVAWSPAGGTHLVKGALLADWTRRGGPAGPVGWPTRDEVCPPGGCLVTFTGGTLSWTPARGVLLSKGAIGQRWTQEGAAAGFLGWPTGERPACPVAAPPPSTAAASSGPRPGAPGW